ncbi:MULTISPECIES: serine/threonine-protein kinase [Streptomyces]|uniref:serine/threonine-protein kinase n=1 Tax=Streptomyces TaxID=1883 RepID=UPI00018039BA|nr:MULTISPECIES: serine/threonine-protein kinase [Streptomyces]MYT05318.1 protein kinase [Streptomyces sp. SID5470]
MPLHKDDPKSVGGYRLADRLGSGGMGIVYLGRARSGREVAVKVVHAQYAEDKVFRARFRQEIESVRKVSGAFTAPVVDADSEAVRPWMATQYVPGPSLADRIRERGALRDGELRRLALGLVEALRDIHRAGVVHRDLKPANVLMAEDGPRVIDFGISRAAENHNTLTETGQMIGTPPFMSPEQFTDARTVGPASDVFSLGALLVFALTGRGPFDADSPYLTAFRVVHEAPVLNGVAQPLRAVLERCLAKEAAKRPGLDELARTFAEILPEPHPDDPATVTFRPVGQPAVEEAPVEAGPAATARPGRGWGRRTRSLVAAGTVGVLSLGFLAYLGFGPGFPGSSGTAGPSPSAASRWAAVPADWEPWQTTVYATASKGADKPLRKEGESTCVTHEDAVYCGGSGLLPVRLDGRTGRTVWRADLASNLSGTGRYDSVVLGVRDGAVLVQQIVYEESFNQSLAKVVALDAESGEQLWAREMNQIANAATLADDLLLTPVGRKLTARSPRTGAGRWTFTTPADHYCTYTTLGTALYAQCLASDTAENTRFLELNRTDGSVVRRLEAPYACGLLGTVGGRAACVAGGDGSELLEDTTFGEVLLLDPRSGTRTTTKLTRRYQGSVTMAAGTLWIAGTDGRVTAVSPLTGKQLWQTRTGVERSGRPTYDTRSRTLYLVSPSGRVAALDAHRGRLLWETGPRAERLSNSEGTKPEVLSYGGALVVTTPDGTVFSLDPAHPGTSG